MMTVIPVLLRSLRSRFFRRHRSFMLYDLPAPVSTRVKPPFLWHPISRFPFRTDIPCNRRDPNDNEPHYRGIGLPIRGLRVPSTCWRPDMLWVGYFSSATVFDGSTF